MKSFKYDLFISHASEDKVIFVRKLAKELEIKGYKIWYDEMSLELGDSLLEKIQEGIKDSLFGLVVLSKSFIKKSWTKKELNAILSKEILTNQNIILPIWYDITYEEIFEYSPFVADKFAIKTTLDSFQDIVDKIASRISLFTTTKQDIINKIEFLKYCNSDERKSELVDIYNRLDRIFLYQEAYYNYYINIPTENKTDSELEEFYKLSDYEFKRKYNIPPTVWTNPEPFDKTIIEKSKKLIKKWINRKMVDDDSIELYVLLDEFSDTDIPYILYGFPHKTLRVDGGYQAAIDGIHDIGNKSRPLTPTPANRSL